MATAEKTARDSIGRLTDARLVSVWMQTHNEPTTEQLARVRGWLMDELETRMKARDRDDARSPYRIVPASLSRFDRWLNAECQAPKTAPPVSPGPYLR